MLIWHGGWVSRPHVRVLEARALLVCHRRFFVAIYNEMVDELLVSRPTMKGHRAGHATVSGFPRTHATNPTAPALCALSWLVMRLDDRPESLSRERSS